MISTTYTILSNIYISRLARSVDEITGNQQYGAACTKSTICAFCIRKTLGGKNGNSIELYTSYLQTSTRPMVQSGGRFCIKFTLSSLSP
jgi:hypothetical protein